MGKFDEIDLKLIRLLQQDASRSVAVLAEEAGLSHNACWRRIKRFEEQDILEKRVAIFDADKLGYSLIVFAILRVSEHNAAWLQKFSRKIMRIPEVVEFYRMSGDIDYMAKLIVRDVRHYDEIYKRLIDIGPIKDITASFAMEDIKYTTAVPV